MERDSNLILFCDESEKDGAFYSNFYGGVLVGSSMHDRISKELNQEKEHLNLRGEVKWGKLTENYLVKYCDLLVKFFDYVRTGHLKIRIMFSQNAVEAKSLTKEDHELRYFKLYYQFIKHSFGFKYFKSQNISTNLRIYLDEISCSKRAKEGAWSMFND